MKTLGVTSRKHEVQAATTPTANAERRGARPKLENENFARARPAEAGKPGLSGRGFVVWAGGKLCQLIVWVRVAALHAREGGFVGRSRKQLGFATRVASKKIKKKIPKPCGLGKWNDA